MADGSWEELDKEIAVVSDEMSFGYGGHLQVE